MDSASRLRRVVSGLSGYSLNTLVIIGGSFITFPIAIRLLGTSAWGHLAVSQAVGTFAAVFVGFGWSLVGPSEVARLDNHVAKSAMLADSVLPRAVFFCALTVPAYVVASYLVRDDAVAAIASVTATMSALGAGWWFVGMGKPYALLLLETLPRLLGSAVGLAIMAKHGSLNVYVVSQAFGVILSLFISYGYVRLRFGYRGLLSLNGFRLLKPHGLALLATATSSIYVLLPVTIVSAVSAPITASFAAMDRVQKLILLGVNPILQFSQGALPRGGDEQAVLRHLRSTLPPVALSALVFGLATGLLLRPAVEIATGGQVTLNLANSLLVGAGVSLIVVSRHTGLVGLASLGANRALFVSTACGAVIGLALLPILARAVGLTGAWLALTIAEMSVLSIQFASLAKLGLASRSTRGAKRLLVSHLEQMRTKRSAKSYLRASPAGYQSKGEEISRPHRGTQAFLLCAIFLEGLRLPSAAGGLAAVGFVVLVGAPIWVPRIAFDRLAHVILLSLAVGISMGWLLAFWRSASHLGPVDVRAGLFTTIYVTFFVLVALMVYVTARFTTVAATAIAYGAGGIARAFASNFSLTPQSFLKFQLLFPLSLLILSVCSALNKKFLTVLFLVVLIGAAVWADARSFAAFCLVTLFIVLSSLRKAQAGAGRSRRRTAWAFFAPAIFLYFIGPRLAVSGLLGKDIAIKSQAQIDAGGSLLAGGRPEWYATAALMRQAPWGLGFGAVPTASEVAEPKRALLARGVGTYADYVTQYLFGKQYELHSIAADLWASAGIPGILSMAAIAIFLIARLLDTRVIAWAESGWTLLVVSSLWSIMFGPLTSNFPELMLALGLTCQLTSTMSSSKGARSSIGRRQASEVVR